MFSFVTESNGVREVRLCLGRGHFTADDMGFLIESSRCEYTAFYMPLGTYTCIPIATLSCNNILTYVFQAKRQAQCLTYKGVRKLQAPLLLSCE